MPTPPDDRPQGTGGRIAAVARRAGQSWKWLKWPVALGILWWLYFKNQEHLEKLAGAPKNWGQAGIAFALIAGASLVTFLRWYLLVRAQDFPFRLRDAVRYGFVGLVAAYIGGTVGGDVFKAYLLAKDQSSRRSVAAATVLLDRILGLLALFMVGVLALLTPHSFPNSPEIRANSAVLWIGTLGGLAGLTLMLIPGTTNWPIVRRLPGLPVVGHVVSELMHGVQLYQTRPRAVIGALGLSLIGHAGLITGFYFCAQAVEQPWIPNLTAHFYFMPNAELFGVLSMTPAGVGALEWAIQKAYVLLKPETIAVASAEAAGFTAAIVFRVVSVAVAAIGGIYYVASRREISAAMHESARS
ncbi:MAG: flippase-like domain-containing protein [Planctomycetia bacterium]|nr:flippase-like domain-containing protein [Planctomycetia bacterium]